MSVPAALAQAEGLADELTGRLVLVDQGLAQVALRLSELISDAINALDEE